jgi:uncharacterized protein (TIGR00106 family)
MALMEISVMPLGTEQTGVGEYVADLIKYLKKNEIPHILTDMGTVLEGDVDQLLTVAKVLHEMPFQKNVWRVVTHIYIDDRRDKTVHLSDKIRAVTERLS